MSGMGDDGTISAADGKALVSDQAALILAAEALGRSHALERLFRFLLAATLEGRTPKELEIADEVFGRSAESIDQDASIRVHIHRLRKKLDEYYRGPGASQAVRLVIPKADYRLTVEARDREIPGSLPAARRLPGPAIIAAALVFALLTGLVGWWLGQRVSRNPVIQEVRASALWNPMVANNRRVAIVVGDYYIFGQRNPDGTVARLVREFDVNSAKDLEALGGADNVDLGLHYLPVGVGNAVRIVTPILLANKSGGATPSFVIPASQLSPELVKYTNLVYLGYLSGLGSLRDPLFSGSRFAIGDSYDQIVDRRTGRTYSATTPLDREADSPGQDYAIVSSFRGVTGNAIVVIAGTRDAGLMQAAEFVARPEELARLDKLQTGSHGFDALLAIESLENVGLRARLVTASPRESEADWSGRRMQAFPDSPRSDAGRSSR